MRILKAELKKMVSMPMLWGFLAVCLALNTGIVFLYQQKVADCPYFSYVGETASFTGNVLGNEFSEKLSAMPECAGKNRLVSETETPMPVFRDYDTGELADAYIGLYGMSGTGADWLAAKYEKLQSSVETLNREGAGFSLYAAGTTVQMHDLLFGVVLRAVITECCILAVLIMLYLCGYEYQKKTESAVYTTKTGRGIYKYKLAAGMVLSAISFVFIVCLTLSVYFSVFDYSQLWDANVSSGFNYVTESFGMKPFLTWIPFTVGGYLCAMLGLGFALTMVFAMIGAFIGFLSRNSYMNVLLFFVSALAMMAVPGIFSKIDIWRGCFLSQFTPICLWFAQPKWFTDMGHISVIPFHETTGVLCNVLLWGILLSIAWQYVKRKDVG